MNKDSGKDLKRQLLWYSPGELSSEQLDIVVSILDVYHGFGWTKERIDKCHVVVILCDDNVAGVIWLRWLPKADNILDAHICILPEYRKGRWAQKGTVEVLMSLRDLITPRPRGVVAEVHSVAAAKVLRTLGFKFIKSGLIGYISFIGD